MAGVGSVGTFARVTALSFARGDLGRVCIVWYSLRIAASLVLRSLRASMGNHSLASPRRIVFKFAAQSGSPPVLIGFGLGATAGLGLSTLGDFSFLRE